MKLRLKATKRFTLKKDLTSKQSDKQQQVKLEAKIY